MTITFDKNTFKVTNQFGIVIARFLFREDAVKFIEIIKA